jgi:hypothetical protein
MGISLSQGLGEGGAKRRERVRWWRLEKEGQSNIHPGKTVSHAWHLKNQSLKLATYTVHD